MFCATMSGRCLPTHCVLPADAQRENQGLDRVKFIQDIKAVFFDQKFAPAGACKDDTLLHLPSWGVNKKGSMTKEELENFFMNHFAKLFPSKADLPGNKAGCCPDRQRPMSCKSGNACQASFYGHVVVVPLNHIAANHGPSVWFVSEKTLNCSGNTAWDSQEVMHCMSASGKNTGLLMFGSALRNGVELRDATRTSPFLQIKLRTSGRKPEQTHSLV
jgi:hypothetical protein